MHIFFNSYILYCKHPEIFSQLYSMTDQVDLSDESLIAADFNGDDNINDLDIVMMLEYILSTP